MRLHCFTCGKSVSTEVPDDAVVRGVINCPECIEGKSGAHHICADRIDARITIIERQTNDVLRFDLMGKDGQVVRSVEATWTEIRGLGDRNRLMGRLLWSSAPRQEERDRLTEENERLEASALAHARAADEASQSKRGAVIEARAQSRDAERARIRRELLSWVTANTWVGRPDEFPQGVLDKGRFLIALDRICPEE